MESDSPVALSEEELAKIKERADADRLTTWPAHVLRLLATIESRDAELKEANERASHHLAGRRKALAELSSRDQRIREATVLLERQGGQDCVYCYHWIPEHDPDCPVKVWLGNSATAPAQEEK